MHIEKTEIDGVLIVTPAKFGDERGFFSETFKSEALSAHGVSHAWVQDNHAFSSERGVVRGLHFQAPPFAQAKLIRVVRGAIYDVAVDIRETSPTYGRHVGIELSEQNWRQLYVPAGFAHGYCTLKERTEVIYKVSAGWNRDAEGGLRWDDPELGITWPVPAGEAVLNARDKAWASLSDFKTPF